MEIYRFYLSSFPSIICSKYHTYHSWDYQTYCILCFKRNFQTQEPLTQESQLWVHNKTRPDFPHWEFSSLVLLDIKKKKKKVEGSYGITLSNGSLPLNNAEVLTTEIPGIVLVLSFFRASLVAHLVKNPPAMWETWVWFLSGEDPLEKGMATHSSILAWRIPWTEEPGRLQSMGSQRVRHDWVVFTFTLSFLKTCLNNSSFKSMSQPSTLPINLLET